MGEVGPELPGDVYSCREPAYTYLFTVGIVLGTPKVDSFSVSTLEYLPPLLSRLTTCLCIPCYMYWTYVHRTWRHGALQTSERLPVAGRGGVVKGPTRLGQCTNSNYGVGDYGSSSKKNYCSSVVTQKSRGQQFAKQTDPRSSIVSS